MKNCHPFFLRFDELKHDLISYEKEVVRQFFYQFFPTTTQSCVSRHVKGYEFPKKKASNIISEEKKTFPIIMNDNNLSYFIHMQCTFEEPPAEKSLSRSFNLAKLRFLQGFSSKKISLPKTIQHNELGKLSE